MKINSNITKTANDPEGSKVFYIKDPINQYHMTGEGYKGLQHPRAEMVVFREFISGFENELKTFERDEDSGHYFAELIQLCRSFHEAKKGLFFKVNNF